MDGFSNYVMGFQPTMNVYTHYPDSIVIGLSKIGGLIALFKIAQLLRIYHKSKFEKQYDDKAMAKKGIPANAGIQNKSVDEEALCEE